MVFVPVLGLVGVALYCAYKRSQVEQFEAEQERQLRLEEEEAREKRALWRERQKERRAHQRKLQDEARAHRRDLEKERRAARRKIVDFRVMERAKIDLKGEPAYMVTAWSVLVGQEFVISLQGCQRPLQLFVDSVEPGGVWFRGMPEIVPFDLIERVDDLPPPTP